MISLSAKIKNILDEPRTHKASLKSCMMVNQKVFNFFSHDRKDVRNSHSTKIRVLFHEIGQGAEIEKWKFKMAVIRIVKRPGAK